MKFGLVIGAIIIIGGLTFLALSSKSDEGTQATTQTTEAPCEQYKNAYTNERFIVLECVEDYDAAYVYDPVRKKCYFLAHYYHSNVLTAVTCDNLPVPE